MTDCVSQCRTRAFCTCWRRRRSMRRCLTRKRLLSTRSLVLKSRKPLPVGAAHALCFTVARRHPINRLLQEAYAQRLPQADAGQEIRKRKEVWPFVLQREGSIACVAPSVEGCTIAAVRPPASKRLPITANKPPLCCAGFVYQSLSALSSSKRLPITVSTFLAGAFAQQSAQTSIVTGGTMEEATKK